MKISLGSRYDNISKINTANGYGYATDRMWHTLAELGHTVKINDAEAPVEIWFDQPHHWKWNDHHFKIGYHPWESTELKEGWLDALNNCDEVWTPSNLIAAWYADCGVTRPIYVYEHGVDKIWKPVDRKVDKIKFLHVGAEAARKGGWDVLRAFRLAFPHRDDVELTLKMVNAGMGIERVGKTSIVNRKLSLAELIDLYSDHHVFVYPSWGEGFGLTPLQAMATGMPTITVPDWAPYARLLDPNLSLEATLKKSPWQDVHPGKMFRVNQDDLVDKMRWIADNYDQALTHAKAQIPVIDKEYDWKNLTESAFKLLAGRLEK